MVFWHGCLFGAVPLDPITITLLVIAGALVLFVTELLPAHITALLSTGALMATGVLTAEEGFAGFSNSATLTVTFMLILASGVRRTGAINEMARWLSKASQGDSKRFLLLVILLAGPISGLLNNTPVVAIMIPAVVTVAASIKESPSKFLMPLSFAAMLGGTLTLIGTSTNLLGSAISERLGYGAFTMFMFTKVGAVVFVVGAIYLYFVAPKLLPERHQIEEVTERHHLRDYAFELVILPGSPLVGQKVEASTLRRNFNVDVLQIHRGHTSIDQPLGGSVLQEGDVMLVRGSRSELLTIRDEEGVELNPEVTVGLPGSSGETHLVEAVIAPGSMLEGASLTEAEFSARYGAEVLSIKKRERLFPRRFGRINLEAGDTLLVSANPESLEALKEDPDFIVAEELEQERFRSSRIPVALSIMGAVVLAASLGWFPIVIAAFLGVLGMVLTGCVQPHELPESIRWDVFFLLAGLIPLGTAMEQSGAANLISESLVATASALPALGVLFVFYMATTVLTQVISNNASIVLMIPVAVETATTLSLNPLTFILGVVFAASTAFMTPLGYQTNLMVYGPGEYRFLDYTKVGLPLNILVMITTVFTLNYFWPLAG